MTSYNFGDIVLIGFPHTDLQGTSKKPAIVLYDSGDQDVLLARITTQEYTTETDYRILDWQKKWSSCRVVYSTWQTGHN
jgi:mRNA interferase MazF